jgi:hypothetical protein
MMQIQSDKLQFTEYLKKLPSTWVIEHFLKEDTTTRKILSSAVIEETAVQFITSGAIVQQFLALNTHEQVRCAQMYLMGSLGIASDSDAGLNDPLVKAFLGYAAKDVKGNIRIFGFDQFEPTLRQHLSQTIVDTAAKKNPYSPHPVFSHRCCNDITIVISLASQHVLVKKKNGKLGVNALQLIKKLTHTNECNKQEDIDLLACAITGYCTSRKLLFDNEQEFMLNPAGFADWLTIPLQERVNDIIGFVLPQYGGWNRELLHVLCAHAGEQWISLSMFPAEDAPAARAVLTLLQFCTIIELQKNGSDILFQTIPPGSPQSPSIDHQPMIMPDFTVIIPQECLPETLYTFARFCNVTALDRIYHAAIEKTVLTESLSSGVESLQIITALEQWNAPSNVIETVREWIREFHRLALTTGSILITAEEKVTEQIASCEQLQPCIERVHVHSIFRIKPGCEHTVRDIVRKLGFDDRMPQSPAAVYTPEEEPLQFEMTTSPWTIVTEDTSDTQKTTASSIRGTKYGAELKSLELSDMVQVIDYAILTGQRIVISYDGSPYVRKGMYTLTPSVCSKGVEPMLEGTLQPTGVRKQFYVKKIISIGVVPQ